MALLESVDVGKAQVTGFNLSTDTVICLPFLKILNVFAERWRTGNGPSYGGVKGLLTASTRRKTWEDARRPEQSLAGGTP